MHAAAGDGDWFDDRLAMRCAGDVYSKLPPTEAAPDERELQLPTLATRCPRQCSCDNTINNRYLVLNCCTKSSDAAQPRRLFAAETSSLYKWKKRCCKQSWCCNQFHQCIIVTIYACMATPPSTLRYSRAASTLSSTCSRCAYPFDNPFSNNTQNPFATASHPALPTRAGRRSACSTLWAGRPCTALQAPPTQRWCSCSCRYSTLRQRKSVTTCSTSAKV
jgi:hypothetical protein